MALASSADKIWSRLPPGGDGQPIVPRRLLNEIDRPGE